MILGAGQSSHTILVTSGKGLLPGDPSCPDRTHPSCPPRPAGLSVHRTSATGLRTPSSQQTWVRGTGDRSNTEKRGDLALDKCPNESQLCMGRRSPEDVHRLHPAGPPSLHQLHLHTHAHAVHTGDSPPPTEHAHGRPAHSLITHSCRPSQSWEGNHKPALRVSLEQVTQWHCGGTLGSFEDTDRSGVGLRSALPPNADPPH